MADKNVEDIDKRTQSTIERERLELERARLDLERARQRSTLLQIGLPLLVSVIAISLTTYSERQRGLLEQQRATLEYNKAVSSYNEGRLELFRKRVERATSDDQIKSIYAEVFPRDSVTLRGEQEGIVRK